MSEQITKKINLNNMSTEVGPGAYYYSTKILLYFS